MGISYQAASLSALFLMLQSSLTGQDTVGFVLPNYRRRNFVTSSETEWAEALSLGKDIHFARLAR